MRTAAGRCKWKMTLNECESECVCRCEVCVAMVSMTLHVCMCELWSISGALVTGTQECSVICRDMLEGRCVFRHPCLFDRWAFKDAWSMRSLTQNTQRCMISAYVCDIAVYSGGEGSIWIRSKFVSGATLHFISPEMF